MTDLHRPTCETCVYFDRSYGLADERPLPQGHCCREHPAPRVIVYLDSWCGQHHLFAEYIVEFETAHED